MNGLGIENWIIELARHAMKNVPPEFEHFKQKLLHLRDSLVQVEASGNAAAQTVELDQSTVGRLSRMEALQGQAMAKESQHRRELQQRRIESALQRIENGTYGRCIRCEEDIHHKRLDVDPTTLFCIECAQIRE